MYIYILFNLFSETSFQETLEGRSEGVTINDEVIKNLRFADETVLFAKSIKGLQCRVYGLYNKGKEYRLNINLSKTKLMIITRKI